MLIPVFTVHANHLTSATPTLIGIALGSYGLSQGLLQIPFGLLSDRFGRKPMITIGLILFAAGSLLGAYTTSIQGMILARTIQGTGAIGSVLIALLADLTPDEHRTKAMAIIGMTIGMSFSLAMVISPALTHHFGLSGIFYLTTLLALIGLIILHGVIPTPKKEPFHTDSGTNPALFKQVLCNTHLQRLNVGIFCQHFILTSTFFAIPILLQQQLLLGHLTKQWHFYLPLMVLSFFVMVPFLVVAEKKKRIKTLFVLSVLITFICQVALVLNHTSWFAICGFMFAYFVVFNILEASLPSLISKQASSESKGTAMGIYSSSQFLGIFAGGAVAGIVYQYTESQGIFMINSLVAMIWLIIAHFIEPELYLTTLILPYENNQLETSLLIDQLKSLPGVQDVAINLEESTIYLRLNKALYRDGSANQLLRDLSVSTTPN